MAETLETQCENPSNIERCTEALRARIASQEEKIAGAVEEVSEIIKNKFHWRHYVGQAPYLTLGVAAGLGFLASRMIVPEPPTTMEKVSDIIQEATGARVGNFIRSRRQRTILSSLGGLALTMGVGLAKRAVMNALVGGANSAIRRASAPEQPLSASSS